MAENTKIKCAICEKSKSSDDFYIANTAYYGKTNIDTCKSCINTKAKEDGLPFIYDLFQRLDIPFIHTVWDTVKEEKTSIGIYIRRVRSKFPPFKTATNWKDSIFYPNDDNPIAYAESMAENIDFFGEGFTEQEYKLMAKKYSFLKNNYNESTNFHTEALKTYVRYRVKEELATSKNEVADAQKWATMAKDAAIQAKISPSQMSKTDLQGGLNNFSELIRAVEEKVDIIKVQPRFKYMPQDAPDFIIWTYVNYVRDLKGLPPAKYDEIYEFYDKKKQEHLDQYGDPFDIFKDDLDIRNRGSISKFVSDYSEKIMNEKENASNSKSDDVFGGD